MITPDSAIRGAIYTALTTPPIEFGEHQVGVFDSIADEDAIFPYVVLDTQQSLPANTKDMYLFTSSLTMRIIDIATAEASGRARSEDVLALVLPRIMPATPSASIPFSVIGWKVYGVIVSSTDLVRAVTSGIEYQKVLSLTLNIY